MNHEECAFGNLRDDVVGDDAVSACFFVIHKVRGQLRESISKAKEATVLEYASTQDISRSVAV